MPSDELLGALHGFVALFARAATRAHAEMEKRARLSRVAASSAAATPAPATPTARMVVTSAEGRATAAVTDGAVVPVAPAVSSHDSVSASVATSLTRVSAHTAAETASGSPTPVGDTARATVATAAAADLTHDHSNGAHEIITADIAEAIAAAVATPPPVHSATAGDDSPAPSADDGSAPANHGHRHDHHSSGPAPHTARRHRHPSAWDRMTLASHQLGALAAAAAAGLDGSAAGEGYGDDA